MGIKFSNNAEGTLAGNIAPGDLTLTLNAGQGAYFPVVTSGPDDFFYCTLTNVGGNREVIKVTQHTAGDVFQTIERAVDSIQEEAVPTAYAFSTNDTCQLRVNKLALEGMSAGSSETTFQIDTENDGPALKNNSGTMEIRLYDDSDYADLHAEGLTLEAALVIAGAVTGVTDLTASGTITAVTGDFSGAITAEVDSALPIDNEGSGHAITAEDHGTATDPEVVNVIYGTGSAPAASGVPVGTIYLKYIA